MTNQVGTIDELLQLAIRAEKNMETVYEAIGRMFISYPEVSAFWQGYANEEAGHAHWLEGLRHRVSDDQLARPADPEMWAQATRLVATDPESLLIKIEDLQDAWELANELENGETNVVFEFMISNFTKDPSAHSFLRAQLRGHLDHLMTDFPASYNNNLARGSIRASVHAQS